jgi:hypothetical protein
VPSWFHSLILISLETIFEIFVPGIQHAYSTVRPLPKNAVPPCLQYPMNAGRIPKTGSQNRLIQIYKKWEDEG